MSADEAPKLLEGPAAFAAAALELVRAARAELLLLSDSLERRSYGTPEFAEALKTFVLGSERARLWVLVNQPAEGLRNVPRLTELYRRASSRIEFREPPEDRREECRCEWLIADRRGLLERRGEVLEAQFFAEAPQRGKLRAEAFEAIWNESVPVQDLRSLGL